MIESVVVAKILVSMFLVMGLSLVAENVSPKVAGVLSGYPLGTAIVLFFVGLENGTQFAANSSIYTLGGLSASLFLIYIYYSSSNFLSAGGVLLSSITSIMGFLFVAGLLRQFSFSLIEGFLITVSAIVFFRFQFRNIENVKVNNKVKLTYKVILFRSSVAAFIVVLITSLAKSIGPEWSGILSAFPATLYPLLLVIHLTYGKQQANTIIKNFPNGVGALVIYTISVSFTYPVYGIYYGTLLCFILATLYLILYAIAVNYWVPRST